MHPDAVQCCGQYREERGRKGRYCCQADTEQIPCLAWQNDSREEHQAEQDRADEQSIAKLVQPVIGMLHHLGVVFVIADLVVDQMERCITNTAQVIPVELSRWQFKFSCRGAGIPSDPSGMCRAVLHIAQLEAAKGR